MAASWVYLPVRQGYNGSTHRARNKWIDSTDVLICIILPIKNCVFGATTQRTRRSAMLTETTSFFIAATPTESHVKLIFNCMKWQSGPVGCTPYDLLVFCFNLVRLLLAHTPTAFTQNSLVRWETVVFVCIRIFTGWNASTVLFTSSTLSLFCW